MLDRYKQEWRQYFKIIINKNGNNIKLVKF